MLGHGPISGEPISGLEAPASESGATQVFRQPLITPISRKRSAHAGFSTPNLLLSTLAVVAAVAPFIPAQFDTPERRNAAQQPQPQANLLLTTLADVPAPFRQEDFQSPARRAHVAQPALTATGRPPDTIIPAFPTSRPDTQTHPGPRRSAPQALQPPNLLTSTLAVVVPPEMPVGRQTDFQNPGRRKLLTTAIPWRPDVPPPPDVEPPTDLPVGRQLDWPNPARRAHSEGVFEGVVYLAPDLPAGRPIHAPNPTVRRHAQQPQPLPNLLTSTLFTIPAPPFKQTNWPNPALRKYVLRTTIARSSYDPPAPPAPPEPFPAGRQTDFQNPVSRHRSLTGIEFEHGHYQEIPDYLLTSLLHDWQNPTVKRRAQQPQPLPNLLTGTLFEPPAPIPVGRQLDFPNPVRAKYTQIRYEFSGTPVPNEIPPPIVPPEPVPSGYVGGGGGGGGGGEWYKETRKRPTVYDRLHQDIKEVVIDPKFIRDVYEELMASDEAAPALEKAVRVPKAPSGADDWDAMARDMEQVRALMLQAQAEQKRREIAEDDADWEWF